MNVLTGIELIATERKKQISRHKHTGKRDYENNKHNQLVRGAIALLDRNSSLESSRPTGWQRELWDKLWSRGTKDRLIIAGALIAAELDRLAVEGKTIGMEVKDDETVFINESGLEFEDISSEAYRSYHFTARGDEEGSGTFIGLHIHRPWMLNVSPSGGHRLVTKSGKCFYINTKDGFYIEWTPEPGQPHFVR